MMTETSPGYMMMMKQADLSFIMISSSPSEELHQVRDNFHNSSLIDNRYGTFCSFSKALGPTSATTINMQSNPGQVMMSC